MTVATNTLCAICKGSGGLFSGKPVEIWQCLYCGGSGARVQFSRPTIGERR